MNSDEIKKVIKAYIMSEFLPDEDPAELTDSVELISGKIIDSIAALKLVSFMEERFGITVDAHEVSEEYMNTLPLIAELVTSKM